MLPWVRTTTLGTVLALAVLALAVLAGCGSGSGAKGPFLERPRPQPLPAKRAAGVEASPRVVKLALGFRYSCALLSNGVVRCWGEREELGYPVDGNIGDDDVPAKGQPVALDEPAFDLQVSGGNACVLVRDGRVRCWGQSLILQGLMKVPSSPRLQPTVKPIEIDFGGPVLELAVGAFHLCSRLGNGVVRCLGLGKDGELGRGVLPDEPRSGLLKTELTPGDVALPGPARHVWAGEGGACAELEDRTLSCWGSAWARAGRKVTNPNAERGAPVAIDVGGLTKQVVMGQDFACALLEDGAIRCWGSGYGGVLGHGNQKDIGDVEAPAALPALDVGDEAAALTAGSSHACALLRSGNLRCWGLAEGGRLGYANGLDVGDDEIPARASDVPVGERVRQVAAGAFHTCALLTSGGVRCWGNGEKGELGYATTASIGERDAPVDWGDVPLLHIKVVTPPPPRRVTLPPGTEKIAIDWSDEQRAPAARTCANPCRGCRELFDSTTRLSKSVPLSASEEASVRAVYENYLVSDECQADPRHLDLNGVGSAQDGSSITDVVTGSFSAAGRQQKLVLLFVGHCGVSGSHAENWGQRLLILLENGKVALARIDRASSWLRPVDLEGDGRTELLIGGGWAGAGGGNSWLSLLSLADSRLNTLADFDQVDSDSCSFPPGEHWESKILYRATPGPLCLLQQTRNLGCPK